MTIEQSKMYHGKLCQCPECRGRPLECVYCKAEADCICRHCESCDGVGSGVGMYGVAWDCDVCIGRGKVKPKDADPA